MDTLKPQKKEVAEMFLFKWKMILLCYKIRKQYVFLTHFWWKQHYTMPDLCLSRFFLITMYAPFFMLFLIICVFWLFCGGACVSYFLDFISIGWNNSTRIIPIQKPLWVASFFFLSFSWGGHCVGSSLPHAGFL